MSTKILTSTLFNFLLKKTVFSMCMVNSLKMLLSIYFRQLYDPTYLYLTYSIEHVKTITCLSHAMQHTGPIPQQTGEATQ